MKKIVKIVSFISSMMFLGACTGSLAIANAYENHEHEFNSEYSYDDVFHWKDSNCEHDYINGKEEHSFGEYRISKSPSEYKDGEKIRTCSICGFIEKTVIPALEHTHTYEDKWSYDEVNHWHNASCGDDSVISFGEHQFTNWMIKKEAKDEIEGVKYRYCETCGYTEEDVIEALEHQHTFTRHWSYDENNHWHDSTCLCDLVSELSEHDFDIDIVEPTFERAGLKTFTCKVCKYTYTENIDQLIHRYSEQWTITEEYHWHACIDEGYEYLKSDYSSHNYVTIVTPSTFETKGYTTHKCKDCNYYYIDSETDLLPHNYSSTWLIDEEKGTHYHACIDEGYEELRSNEATHTYGSAQYVAPTFEEEGYYISTCKVCGYYYFHDYVPVLEHNYSSTWLIDEEKGTHYHACIDEGYEELRGSEAPHNYVGKITASTFYEQGYTTYTCSVCGDSYISDYTPVLNSDDFLVYELINDDTEYMVSTSNWKIIELNIPAAYEGLPVTKIKERGFSGCSYLTNIVVPNSINEIGKGAFKNCTKLESLMIPFVGGSLNDNNYLGYIFGGTSYSSQNNDVPSSLKKITLTSALTHIPDYAFYKCNNLNIVNLPLSLSTIGKCAFYECSSLSEMVIPNGVVGIGENAFASAAFKNGSTINYLGTIESWASIVFGSSGSNPLCSNSSYSVRNLLFNNEKLDELNFTGINKINDNAFYNFRDVTSISFDDNITSIGNRAFYGCINLETIDLKDSITSIGEYAFTNCSSLLEIKIPASLTSIERELFSYCSKLQSVEFNESVTSIGKEAFCGCSQLIDVILNAPLSSIEYGAFYNCNSLKHVYIPNTVTTIASSTFAGCGKAIFYIEHTSKPDTWKNELVGSNATNVMIWGAQKDKIMIMQDGAEYYINSAGKAVLVRFDDSNKTSFIVPTTITYLGNTYNVTEIAPYAFKNNISLQNITFQEGLLKIGNYAFIGCSSVLSIDIPDSLTSLGRYCFQNCTGIETVSFGKLTSLPVGAFMGCSSIVSITIPSTLTSLDGYCFEDCTSLESVLNSSNLTYIGGMSGCFVDCVNLKGFTFNDSISSASGFKGCTSLTSITLPKSLSTIYSSAFNGCTNLRSVTFTNTSGGISIEQYAFYNCESLENINSANRITIYNPKTGTFKNCTSLTSISIGVMNTSGINITSSIPSYFFSGCTNLSTVSIGGDIKTIESYAFENCTSLSQYEYVNVTLKKICVNAFAGCTNLESIIYQNSKSDWNSNTTLESGWITGRNKVTIKCTDGNIVINF